MSSVQPESVPPKKGSKRKGKSPSEDGSEDTTDGPRVGKYCGFTINNYTEDDIKLIHAWAVQLPRISCTREVGESGTPHLQGFFASGENHTYGTLKKLHPTAHWTICRKAEAMALYPIKADSDVVVNQNNLKQGHRSDIEHAYDAALAGEAPEDFIRRTKPGDAAMRAFERGRDYLIPDRPVQPITVLWIYGPPGSGKSSAAGRKYPDAFRVSDFRNWHGYRGQATVIVDDVRPEVFSMREFLMLTDIYPFKVNIKYGQAKAQFSTIVFTTPAHPKDFFEGTRLGGTPEDLRQVMRRITRLIEFEAAEQPPPEPVVEKFTAGGDI